MGAGAAQAAQEGMHAFACICRSIDFMRHSLGTPAYTTANPVSTRQLGLHRRAHSCLQSRKLPRSCPAGGQHGWSWSGCAWYPWRRLANT